jgi:uncharacterized protein (DUF885 family)
MGQSELQGLHAQMDAILKEIGYAQGTVGERMNALAKDPRYKSQGDKGRAEIMALINNRVDWIRAQMPRAFNKVVQPNMEVKRLPPEEEPGAPGAYGGAGLWASGFRVARAAGYRTDTSSSSSMLGTTGEYILIS